MKIYLSDNHFHILGVTRFSTKEEIKKAYRDQIKRWHPDRFANSPEKYQEALERSKKINEAFGLLKSYDPPNIPNSDRGTRSYTNKSERPVNKGKPEKLNISRIPVKSSNLRSVGYDKMDKVLQVEFRSGAIYQYYDVPEFVYFELLQADSKGMYFNGNIASYFRYESV